jgi:hypothetical protein
MAAGKGVKETQRKARVANTVSRRMPFIGGKDKATADERSFASSC